MGFESKIDEEVPIFTDTNLGTRIALSVPPDIPAKDFKKKLESAHLKCFPGSKEIQVYGLMVKRRSSFYHLPDSVPINLAFQGVRGPWFMRVEARTLTQYLQPRFLDNYEFDNSGITDPLELEDCVKYCAGENHKKEEKPILVYVSRKKKKKIRQTEISPPNIGFDCRQGSRSLTDVPSKVFSEVKSVTSIINRYFPSSNVNGFASPTSSDVTSKRKKTKKGNRRRCCSSMKVGTKMTVKGRIGSAEVGKRLVTATSNLGVSSTKKYFLVPNKASSSKRLVFEISDSDE